MIFHVCILYTHHTIKVTISSDHQLKRISKLANGKYFTIGLASKLVEGVEVHRAPYQNVMTDAHDFY